MKSSNEMVRSLLDRKAQYEEKQTRKKIFYRKHGWCAPLHLCVHSFGEAHRLVSN